MKIYIVLLIVLVLSLWVTGFSSAEDSGDLDLVAAIQQQPLLNVSAFFQYRMDPPMGDDGLLYMAISPNPSGDDVMEGWVINPNYDYGDSIFGFVYNNYLIGRDAYMSGCFAGPVANPTTLGGCYLDEELETIVTYVYDAWSPPTTLPEYQSWFHEGFEDGVADNWFPTDPLWFVDEGLYTSTGTGAVGWRGSYYARIYDTANAGLTYYVDIDGGSSAGEHELTLVFFADPTDPDGYCYEFSAKYGPPATYRLRKVIGGAPTNLIDPTPSDAIEINEGLGLKVVTDMVAGGLKITLYINEELQASLIDDAPYTSGVVGIGIHDATGFGEVLFESILLHRLTTYLEQPAHMATEEISGKFSRVGSFR
jgi:hypothetical protein